MAHDDPWASEMLLCNICGEKISNRMLFSHSDVCKELKQQRVAEKWALSELVPLFKPYIFERDGGSTADAHLIVPNLYLGNVSAARNEEFIRSMPIRCLLNCAAEVRPMLRDKRIAAGVVWYRQLEIDDNPLANFFSDFVEGAAAVHEALQVAEANGGSLLVHCAAGVSRSATVVIAYLVRYAGMALHDAVSLVKLQRPYIYPNSGFWQDLITMERAVDRPASIPLAASKLLHWESLSTVSESVQLPLAELEDLAARRRTWEARGAMPAPISTPTTLVKS